MSSYKYGKIYKANITLGLATRRPKPKVWVVLTKILV